MRRWKGGRTMLVLAVAMVSAAAVAAPAAAQAEEPAAEVLATQKPNVLSLAATGCYFSPGSPAQITFSGGGGQSREFSKQVGDDTCFSWNPPDLNPCQLGASDLPGTQYTVTVAIEAAGYSLDQLITLEPDTTKPRFLDPAFAASPRPGSSVKVGDEINFEVTATDKTPAPSWQTGVHSLQVTGPEGLVGGPQDGGRVPKACGEKSKSLTVQGSHRVRRSDPAVIELCAITEDYAPNENTKCAQWYKGEVWKGKLTSEHSIPVTPCTHTWSGTFEFGVVEDQVLGSATVSPGGCGGIAGPVTITGTADDAGFTLSSDSYLLAAGTRAEKTAPDRAEGTSEYHDAYNDVITTLEMECKKNCDEGPVG